jgi:hypothetical protein
MDRIAVMTIADEDRWEAKWDTPRGELRDKLAGIEPRGSHTRLWDSLETALHELDQNSLPRRRRLIVISDGHDEGSSATLEQIAAHAGRLRIPVDTVAMTQADARFVSLLARLSKETQGQYRAAPDDAALRTHIAGGIEQMLGTPVVTFQAQKLPGDGLTAPDRHPVDDQRICRMKKWL